MKKTTPINEDNGILAKVPGHYVAIVIIGSSKHGPPQHYNFRLNHQQRKIEFMGILDKKRTIAIEGKVVRQVGGLALGDREGRLAS